MKCQSATDFWLKTIVIDQTSRFVHHQTERNVFSDTLFEPCKRPHTRHSNCFDEAVTVNQLVAEDLGIVIVQ